MTDINYEKLDQIIQQQRQAMPADTSAPPQEERRGFSDGLQQGWHGIKAAAGGLTALAGEKLESDALYDAGMGLYDRETAQASEHELGYGLSDLISPRDDLEREPSWGEYISHSLGVMLPSVGLSMGSGGAGGIAARGVAHGLTRNLSTRGAAQAAQTGQIGGAVASGAGEYTGSLYGELGDSDVALAHGIIAGTLDAVLPAGLLRAVSPSMRSKASDEITKRVLEDAAERGVLQNMGRRGVQGAVTEGVTEGLQSLVEQHARYWVEENGESLLANAPDVDWRSVVDGMGVGVVAGTGLSAPSGLLESRNAQRGLAQLNQQEEQASAPLSPEEGSEGRLDETNLVADETEHNYQRASDLGNRIQMAMSSVDDIAGRAKGTFEATTRLRNVRRLIDESERHFENNDIDLAEIKLSRAQEIERSLQENLSRVGTRERPLEGEVFDEPPISGLLEGNSAPRLDAPDPNIINMGGPTEDTTQYDPPARYVRRDKHLAAQRQGEQKLHDQATAEQSLLADSDTVDGQQDAPQTSEVDLREIEVAGQQPQPQNQLQEQGVTLKADGKPFQTRRAAELSKRFRDTANAQAVEVDGGWGFTSQPMSDTQADPLTDTVESSPLGAQQQPDVHQDALSLAPGQPSPTPSRMTPQRVPVADIQVDPEAYQFRTNVNQDGVDSRLEGVEKWDDLRAGNLVLHERLDGTLYAADGHHRINLARQLEQPDVNALVLREADGVTVEDARIEAATANIAAGNATAIDAAKVFRNTDVKPVEAISRFDLPRKSPVVRDGIDIAKLANDAFGSVLNGVVTEKDGAAIGRAFSDPDQQMAAIEVFQRVKPSNENQRALLANEVRQAGFARSQSEQGGLFGDDPAESLIGERVRVMDNLRQSLVRDRRLFATLNENAKTAEKAGNRIAKDRNSALQDASAEAVALLERATTTPEINQQINDAARRVKDGEPLASVTRELKETLLNGPDTRATEQPRAPALSSRPANQAGQDAGGSAEVSGRNDARAARTSQQRVGDDTGQQQASVTLKTDGKPFQTRRAVELSKRFRDTPNAQPVEVDGGWGFSVQHTAQDSGHSPIAEQDTAQSEIPTQDNQLAITDERQASQQPEAFLETQTEESLAQREQQVQQAEQAEADQRTQEALRAQADREAGDFVLSGSNRPSDIAESRGQNDIFSTPSSSEPITQVASPVSKQRKPKKLTPRQQLVSDAFGGAMVGDTIKLASDVGYAKAGASYTVDSINKDGTLQATSEERGSSVLISRGEWTQVSRRTKAPIAEVVNSTEPAEASAGEDALFSMRNSDSSSTAWQRAEAKGLDMSQEGRMKRALDIGYIASIDEAIAGEYRDGKIVSRRHSQGGEHRGDDGAAREVRPLAVYHGTAGDIDSFQPGHRDQYDAGWLGKGVYVTTNPEQANIYAGKKSDRVDMKGASVLPLHIKPRSLLKLPATAKRALAQAGPEATSRFTENLKQRGYDGVVVQYGDTHEIALFNEGDIRSAHAAFDPDGASSSDLLYSLGRNTGQQKTFPATDQDQFRKDERVEAPASHEKGTPPMAADITAALAETPELSNTHIIQSTAELPPEALLGMMLRGVNPSDVRGMFIGDELYVVADNVQSVEEGIQTAVHEAVGHKGIRGVLGDELVPVMRQVYDSLPRDPRGREALNEVLESYPFLDQSNPEHQITIAEEMVAHLAEKGWQPSVLRRAVAKIRELLRRYFPNMNWTDADVMQLSERSREYLRQQQGDTESKGSTSESSVQGGQQSDDALFSLRNAFDDFSDADRSAAEKIGRPPTTRRLKDYLKQRWEGIGERIRVGAVDQYAALKRLDEQVHGKDMVEENITASSWVLARMSSAANGALHTMMTAGRLRYMEDQRVISMQDGTRGLGEVLGELGSPAEIERFFGWVAGNRSKQLAQQGRENLFEPNEVEAMTTWNRGRLADGRSRLGVYASVFREFQQYRDDVLSIAEETGVISGDARTLWRDEFYVPFYRVQRDEKAPTGPMPAAGLSRQKQMKKLKGGKENLNDLLENTMLNFHYLLEASLKNRAASQALDNAMQAGIAHQVPESNRDTQTSTYVLRDGKKAYYQIDDPMVFNALTALADPGMNSTMMQAMRQMKRIFTVGVTATPQFQVANLMRDSMQAVATSPVSKNAFDNIIKGGMAYRDAKIKAKMMASGGSFHFGHVYGSSPDEIRAQMAKVRSETFTINNLKDMKQGMNRLMAPWQKWTEFNNFTENINRARIYEQNASERGELYANFQARDLIDFGARGAWPAIRILTDIVPFLNARIQGLDKIYRSGIKPGTNVVAAAFGYGQAGVSDKQAAARFWAVAGAMSLASVALYLNNREEEEFKKLEDWQKDSYYHFFFGDTHIQIPKPFEVGAITTLAERITEQFVDDEATGDLFAKRLGHMLTQTFSFSPVPQAVQPMLDVYSNRDAFTGRPIESMGMDRMSPELRRRESTTRLATGISGALNATIGGIGDPDDNPFALSPVQVDHLIGGYFGQLGSWGAGAIDVAWNTAIGKEAPAKRWYEYQPVRRFYRNLGNEDIYTKYGTVFYDGLREAQRAHTDMRELREMGRLEEAQSLARNKGDLLRLRPALNRVQSRLRTITQQIEETQRSGLSAEEKRQRIDRYRAIRNQIQRTLGERVEQARRAG